MMERHLQCRNNIGRFVCKLKSLPLAWKELNAAQERRDQGKN
jgi:hypothetical protein